MVGDHEAPGVKQVLVAWMRGPVHVVSDATINGLKERLHGYSKADKVARTLVLMRYK